MMDPTQFDRKLTEYMGDPTIWERTASALGFHGLARKFLAARVGYAGERAYLDAAKTDRLFGGRGRVTASPHTVWQADFAKTRAAFLYLYDSDEYCRSVMTIMRDNVVGTGIKTQCQIDFSADAAVNNRTNSLVEDTKLRWMEQADVRGQQHWYDLQSTLFQQLAGEGESLLVETVSNAPGRILPLAYEQICLTRLSTYRPVNVGSGNEVVDGLEIDAVGRVVAYHISTGDYRERTERVPADRVIHCFRHDRAGQLRGLSWFAPVIPNLYGLREIKEYAIVARKVQSAIAVLVTRSPGGYGSAPGFNPQAVAQGTGTTAHTITHRAIEPGMIHEIPNGAGVHSHNPSPTSDLDPLTQMMLRGIGIGMGMSYEFVAGDYSRVNFAGGKLSGQNAQRRFNGMHSMYVRGNELRVHRRFMDVAMGAGILPRPRPLADIHAARFGHPSWNFQVNELQAANAAAARLALGISSLRREIEERGDDFNEVMQEISEESEVGQKYGLLVHAALTGAGMTDDSQTQLAEQVA